MRGGYFVLSSFWTSYCKPLDGPCLVNGLRKTQAARLGGRTEERFPNGTLADRVNRAIKPLISGDSNAAARLFEEVLKSDGDRYHTATVFVALYARFAREVQRRHLEELCPVPAAGRSWGKPEATMETNYQLEEFLGTAGDPRNGEVWPELELCLFWNYVGADSEGLRNKANERLQRLVKLQTKGQWMADTRYWAGYELLRSYKPGKSDPADLELARELLAQAIRNHKDAAVAEDEAVGELVNLCAEVKTGTWCWRMRDGVWDKAPKSFAATLQMAYGLFGISADDAQEALSLLDGPTIVDQLSQLPQDLQDPMRAWIAFAKAQGHLARAGFGESRGLTDARSLLEKTIVSVEKEDDKEDWPALTDLYALLSETFRYETKFNEALNVIKQGLAKEPRNPLLLQAKIVLLLSVLNVEDAVKLARISDPKSYNPEVGFGATNVLFLQDQNVFEDAANMFLATEHEYRDYVRLLLYASRFNRDKEAAKDVLEKRWTEIEPLRLGWSQRLQDGDLGAWREMLIGYYLDQVDHCDMLNLTTSGGFHNSGLDKAGISLAALRAEANFYDALLQGTRGNRTREIELLKETKATHATGVYEYHMARYLLNELQPSGAEHSLGGTDQSTSSLASDCAED
jgi:hypothetical protein